MATTFEDGKEFAGYQIISTIGSGGFATVYQAEDLRPAMRRKVALKVLHEQLAADEAFRERFFRESLLAVELDHHPNIVPVYDAGEAEGRFYIAMRFIEGIDLKQKLEGGPLDPMDAAGVISQVGSALDLAHRAGLVHRDVKPGNVLLPGGNTDHVYLADFGLTKETAAESSLTQVGQFLGTLYYAAPEQIEGKDLDGRSDQYALGCMLYECLTGEPPFKGEMQAIIGAHLTRPAPKATDSVPTLPPGIDDVVAKAMSKDPDDRYDSCGELGAHAMRALRAGSPGATVVTGPLVVGTPGAPTPPPPPPPDPNATIVGTTSSPGISSPGISSPGISSPGIGTTPPPGVPSTPPPGAPSTPPPGVPQTPPPGSPGAPTPPPAAPAPAGGGSGGGLSKKVGGIPVWALGAGAIVVILLLAVVGISVLGGDDGGDGPDPTAAPPVTSDDNGNTTTSNSIFDPGNGNNNSAVSLPATDLDRLEDECSSGTLLSCDFLFFESPPGSDQETFGGSCGDTFDGANGTCGTTASGSTVSQDITDCGDGDNAACDELFFATPVGSQLELFGSTCAGRSDDELDGGCVDTFG